MESRTVPCIATVALAHLRIHAEGPLGKLGAQVESALQRLRARCSRGRRHEVRTSLALQVDDLEGQALRAIDDAGPLTDLRLPAGTYHVTATLGGVRRRYTMTLEPGASFDLYLRLADERH